MGSVFYRRVKKILIVGIIENIIVDNQKNTTDVLNQGSSEKEFIFSFQISSWFFCLSHQKKRFL
jgi:hypothetical protein